MSENKLVHSECCELMEPASFGSMGNKCTCGAGEMSEDRKQFEAWFEGQHWGNEDFKTSLEMAWQACAKIKDAEIAELKAALFACQADYAGQMYEVKQLNAKVAMMREALRRISGNNLQSNPCVVAEEALTATEADVTKWVNNVRADALEEVAKKYNTSHATLLPSTHEVADSLRELAKELRGE